MAKKSPASLSIVPPGVATVLSPPRSLTARQKELWKEIVLSKPASWFDRSTAPLLSGYVKAIASHEILASRSDAIEAELADGGGDLKALIKIHAMIERQARLIRLLPQS